jgi:hypothetical protein
MNEIPDKTKFALRQSFGDADTWTKLMALAEMIEIDRNTGSLTLRNGKSCVTLRPDGRVTVEGVDIVQSAERNISLDAATIDLN